MTRPVEQALWANRIQRQCLEEAGDDVEAGLAAAELILSTQPYPTATPTAQPSDQPLSVFFAHDIHNREAQGILNAALKEARGLSASARKDLATAIGKGETDSGRAILDFVDKYRLQLAKLLNSTQLAAVLEGAREIAQKVPTLAVFPGAVPPPPTLEPYQAIKLVERLEATSSAVERAAIIEKLPPAHQQYAREAIIAREAFSNLPPPNFIPPAPPSGTPGEIHYPLIEEAVKSLAEKNVMTRDRFDALDSAARAKAFTVAGVSAEETLTKVRDTLAANMAKGADYATFKQEVLQAVDSGTFLSDAHQETVFRTNVQTAFSDGQQAILSHPLVRSGFPYSAYDAIHDDRVRENHIALEKLGIQGTNVYRNDDPVFQLFRPPWDYNDRCGSTPMTVRQAAEAGITEAQEWLRTGVEPTEKAFVKMPPFQPPPGFQRSINAAPLSIQLSMQPMSAFNGVMPPSSPPNMDMLGVPPKKKHSPPMDPDQHPRDRSNRFVDVDDIVDAANDAESLADLRESIPQEQWAKLDYAVAHLQNGGTIHHPNDQPGLGVNISGEIADHEWAHYASKLADRELWNERNREREERRKCLDRALRIIRNGGDDLDEADRHIKKAGAPASNMRALSRLRHRVGSGRATLEELEDFYEDVIERLHLHIEHKADEDLEPREPEEPDTPALSTDANGHELFLSIDDTGHQHKGKGPGGGQFTKGGGGSGTTAPTKSEQKKNEPQDNTDHIDTGEDHYEDGHDLPHDLDVGDLAQKPGMASRLSRMVNIAKGTLSAAILKLGDIAPDVIPNAYDHCRNALLSTAAPGIPVNDIAIGLSKVIAWAWQKVKTRNQPQPQSAAMAFGHTGYVDHVSAVQDLSEIMMDMAGVKNAPKPTHSEVKDNLESTKLIAEILVAMFGKQADKVAAKLYQENANQGAALGIMLAVGNPKVKKRYGKKPGPGWIPGGMSSKGQQIWIHTASPGRTPAAATPTPAPSAPTPPPAPTPAPSPAPTPAPTSSGFPFTPVTVPTGGHQARAKSIASFNAAMQKLSTGQPLSPAEQLALSKQLTNMPTPLLRQLHVALGGPNVSLNAKAAVNAVKAILTGVITPPSTPSPATPAPTPSSYPPLPPPRSSTPTASPPSGKPDISAAQNSLISQGMSGLAIHLGDIQNGTLPLSKLKTGRIPALDHLAKALNLHTPNQTTANLSNNEYTEQVATAIHNYVNGSPTLAILQPYLQDPAAKIRAAALAFHDSTITGSDAQNIINFTLTGINSAARAAIENAFGIKTYTAPIDYLNATVNMDPGHIGPSPPGPPPRPGLTWNPTTHRWIRAAVPPPPSAPSASTATTPTAPKGHSNAIFQPNSSVPAADQKTILDVVSDVIAGNPITPGDITRFSNALMNTSSQEDIQIATAMGINLTGIPSGMNTAGAIITKLNSLAAGYTPPTPAPTPSTPTPPPSSVANVFSINTAVSAGQQADVMRILNNVATGQRVTTLDARSMANALNATNGHEDNLIAQALGITLPIRGGTIVNAINSKMSQLVLAGNAAVGSPTPTPAPPPPAPAPAPTPAPATPHTPGHTTAKGVLARPTAPTKQKPIDLATAPVVDYSGKNGGQIDPTWSGMDYPGTAQKYGAIVSRVDPTTGKIQVLLAKPKNYFGNTSWTWAKGTQDPGNDAQTTAKNEAMEEVGASGDIVGHLTGTYTEGSKSGLNAYFIMRQTGNIDDAAWKKNNETEEIKWVDLDDAHTHIAETTQHIKNTHGGPNDKEPSFVNWQRDVDVLEQAKAALIPGYVPKVHRRVDMLPKHTQNIAGEIRAIALAHQDGLMTQTEADNEITYLMSTMTPQDAKDVASAMRSGAGKPQDFLNAINKADPGHVGQSPPGPPPRPGLVWNPATHRWTRPATPTAPAPKAAANPAASGAPIPNGLTHIPTVAGKLHDLANGVKLTPADITNLNVIIGSMGKTDLKDISAWIGGPKLGQMLIGHGRQVQSLIDFIDTTNKANTLTSLPTPLPAHVVPTPAGNDAPEPSGLVGLLQSAHSLRRMSKGHDITQAERDTIESDLSNHDSAEINDISQWIGGPAGLDKFNSKRSLRALMAHIDHVNSLNTSAAAVAKILAGVGAPGGAGSGILPYTPPPNPRTGSGGKIGNDDRGALEEVVTGWLSSAGFSAENAIKNRMWHSAHANLKSQFDSSVQPFQIERTLKNLWAQETTVPIPAQFDYMSSGRGPNSYLPSESRPKLSKDEEVAAQKWTSSIYEQFNAALRFTDGQVPLTGFEKMHTDLQTAFAKATTFAKPVQVERTLNLQGQALNDFLTQARQSMSSGTPVEYSGYQATATAPISLNIPRTVVMKINAVHGLDLGPYHHHPHCAELLLNNNSQFKITGVKQVGGTWEVTCDQVAPNQKSATPIANRVAKPAPVHTGTKDFPKDFWSAKSVQSFINGHIPVSKTIKGSTKEYTLLNAILEEAGKNNKPPQLVDKAGIDALKKAGWTIGYRGVNGKQFTDMFKKDQIYKEAGDGQRAYGHGTYIAHGSRHESTDHAEAKGYGVDVMRMAVDPTIKVVKSDDLHIERNKLDHDNDAALRAGKITSKEHSKRSEIIHNDGLLAALLNYDIIDTRPSGTSNYFVLLNRSKVIVQTDNVP